MFNFSTRGAAFLTASENAPKVGDKIELLPMYSRDRLVREESPPLPVSGRVLRVSPEDGATRRVAVRFGPDVPAELATLRGATSTMACKNLGTPSPMPPVGAKGAERAVVAAGGVI